MDVPEEEPEEEEEYWEEGSGRERRGKRRGKRRKNKKKSIKQMVCLYLRKIYLSHLTDYLFTVYRCMKVEGWRMQKMTTENDREPKQEPSCEKRWV